MFLSPEFTAPSLSHTPRRGSIGAKCAVPGFFGAVRIALACGFSQAIHSAPAAADIARVLKPLLAPRPDIADPVIAFVLRRRLITPAMWPLPPSAKVTSPPSSRVLA